MITKTGKELKNIEKCLAYIVANVSMSNSIGKTDINVELERFVKRLLNLYYGLNFELASGISSTYPAIDLIDRDARVACQVTSTNSVKKLKDTMRNFDRLEMSKDFDELKFFILSDKRAPKISKTFGELGTSCTVLTIKTFNALIHSLDDEGKISKVNSLFIGEEIFKPLVEVIKGKGGQIVRLGSIRKLLKQAQLDSEIDPDQVEQYIDDVKALVHEVSKLNVEQRTLLCDLIWKAHTQVGSYTCLYLEESEIAVEFCERERLVISSLVSKNLIEWDESFSKNHVENEITALLIVNKCESEPNIFFELRKASQGSLEQLRSMMVELDYSSLE